MRAWRIVTGCALAFLVVAGSGCMDSGPGGDAGAETSSPGGSALAARKVADTTIRAGVPDAVLLSLDSQGVVLTPPPGNWNFIYGSADTGKTYRVSVNHGKAEKPEELTPLAVGKAVLDAAIDPDTITVGSTEAYQAAKAFVEERDGSSPPNVMMSITFIEAPGAEGGPTPGEWAVAFVTGTSPEGMQQVVVDAQTGEVSAVE